MMGLLDPSNLNLELIPIDLRQSIHCFLHGRWSTGTGTVKFRDSDNQSSKDI